MATNVRERQTREDTPNEVYGNEIHDGVHDDISPSANRVATPTGGSGVSVYERNPAQPIDPTLRPATPSTPASPTGDTPVSGRVPVEPRSTGSIIGWFIGAVLLLVLAYFLVQMIF